MNLCSSCCWRKSQLMASFCWVYRLIPYVYIILSFVRHTRSAFPCPLIFSLQTILYVWPIENQFLRLFIVHNFRTPRSYIIYTRLYIFISNTNFNLYIGLTSRYKASFSVYFLLCANRLFAEPSLGFISLSACYFLSLYLKYLKPSTCSSKSIFFNRYNNVYFILFFIDFNERLLYENAENIKF